jgi:hypothetical protein
LTMMTGKWCHHNNNQPQTALQLPSSLTERSWCDVIGRRLIAAFFGVLEAEHTPVEAKATIHQAMMLQNHLLSSKATIVKQG